MEYYFITAIIVLCFIVLFVFLNKKLSASSEIFDLVKLLRESSSEDRRMLVDGLTKNTNSLNFRLEDTTKTMMAIHKSLGEVQEISKSIKDMHDYIKSPKLRGNLGEQILNELLTQMLPKGSFHLQYTYESGEKVDAVIKTSAGIIPIDSKFPLENFKRLLNAQNETEKDSYTKIFEKDVKTHIDAISRKYIVPSEGTIDYALMYVPSEAVYYEIVNHMSLFDYASDKRVMPISPTTFYAYIKAILMGFEGQKIELKAKEILFNLRSIEKDYLRLEEDFSKLSRHLTNSYNSLNLTGQSIGKLGQKIKNIHELDKEKIKSLT